MARCWYSYNGFGDPLLCSSYNRSFFIPGCRNGPVVCAIYAPGCGPDPTCPLSRNIRIYIANLQLTWQPEPSYPIGAKKYVYGRFV